MDTLERVWLDGVNEAPTNCIHLEKPDWESTPFANIPILIGRIRGMKMDVPTQPFVQEDIKPKIHNAALDEVIRMLEGDNGNV